MSRLLAATLAYHQSDRLVGTPMDVFLALNDGLLRHLNAARTAYRQNQLDRMCRHSQKSLRIVLAIIGAFDPLSKQKGQRELRGFYTAAWRTITGVLSSPCPHSEFDDLIERLQTLVTGLRESRRQECAG